MYRVSSQGNFAISQGWPFRPAIQRVLSDLDAWPCPCIGAKNSHSHRADELLELEHSYVLVSIGIFHHVLLFDPCFFVAPVSKTNNGLVVLCVTATFLLALGTTALFVIDLRAPKLDKNRLQRLFLFHLSSPSLFLSSFLPFFFPLLIPLYTNTFSHFFPYYPFPIPLNKQHPLANLPTA